MIRTFRPDQVSVEARLDRFRRAGAEVEIECWRRLNADLRPPRYHADGQRIIGGGAPALQQTLSVLNAGVTKNTFTTAASIIGADDSGPFSIDYFNTAGASWIMEAMGVVSTTVTPTLQFLVKGASTLGGLTMLAQNAATATLTGLANVDWYIKVMGITRSASGAASTILASGYLLGLIYSATVLHTWLKNATPPTAVTVDLTAGTVFLDLQAAWGTSSASNSITTNFYNLSAQYQ